MLSIPPFYSYENHRLSMTQGILLLVSTPSQTTQTWLLKSKLRKDVRSQEAFNTKLGHLRVTSEDTIGMLKARFPFLRSIPMKITDCRKSVRLVLRVIDGGIILHNLLIDIDDVLPREWWDSNERQ